VKGSVILASPVFLNQDPLAFLPKKVEKIAGHGRSSPAVVNFRQVKPKMTRREWLQRAGTLAGGGLLTRVTSSELFAAAPQGKTTVDAVAASRARMGAIPIESVPLTDNLTLLSGPGGNVAVLNGPDGKLLVDTFVAPAWPQLRQHLDGLGGAPLNHAINTHWHFDHTDNNAHVREAGAVILAHENTKKRLSEPHDLVPLGMHFDPSPANALPQKTFRTAEVLHFNGETLTLGYIPPAHTDSDIFIHFEQANVVHAGDVFFNSYYPFIDKSTNGTVHGMIRGATKLIAIADAKTRIIPGHGPLGDRASLARFRDMLAEIDDNVRRQKAAGKSVEEVVASKPSARFDAYWGKGLNSPDFFVELVYNTL
jgi:cyclase